ncbi:hypothetical protein [Mesorhizobium sp. KR9-304]|uniref:hypothetical protein n=1 Tax=Mesorhizobium sp. KR9-304 TaxID=3156614 RepID=UPI0032B61A09
MDLNVLNFVRIKWGGVRHTQPCYVGFDLQQLAHAPRPHPGRADYLRLNAVLDIARSMPSAARLADLAKALGAILPSNDQERRALIAILGYCGVLVDPAKPDFRESFVPTYLREYAANDWPFPVNWWSAARGVTEEAVDDWFPPTTWH